VGKTFDIVGKAMVEATVRVDEKGRIMIPKSIRKNVHLTEGSYVSVKVEGKAIIVERKEMVADKYAGIFKIENWPGDLDEFIQEASKKWLAKRDT
jgi:AbrB family looped-hinge helix DNA binding protein